MLLKLLILSMFAVNVSWARDMQEFQASSPKDLEAVARNTEKYLKAKCDLPSQDVLKKIYESNELYATGVQGEYDTVNVSIYEDALGQFIILKKFYEGANDPSPREYLGFVIFHCDRHSNL